MNTLEQGLKFIVKKENHASLYGTWQILSIDVRHHTRTVTKVFEKKCVPRVRPKGPSYQKIYFDICKILISQVSKPPGLNVTSHDNNRHLEFSEVLLAAICRVYVRSLKQQDYRAQIRFAHLNVILIKRSKFNMQLWFYRKCIKMVPLNYWICT